ncbi:MAG: RHS repeat-associated core domain-containing protein, partial [Bacteroidota bacterium]
GNILSIYERATPTSEVKQTEVHIYGSSRIGIEQRNITYSTSPFAWLESEQHRHAGTKRYELTDHLGNVRVTISDLLVPRPASSFGYVTQDAEVIDRRDYYPFGMEMPGRRWRAATEGAGRFGFNGKENDNEVKGEGNQQDYGFRIYDPRVARFLSVDPLTGEYVSEAPYQFALSDPLTNIDADGLGPMDRVKFARSFIGTPYRQEAPRTGWNKEAVKTVDCSELVMRVLNLDGHMEDAHMTTESLKKRFENNPDKWEKADQPEVGDVVLWRGAREGHTAVVTDVRDVIRYEGVRDANGALVRDDNGKALTRAVTKREYRIAHASGINVGTVESKWMEAGRGSSKPLVGYFRPRNDSPDVLTDAEADLTPLEHYEAKGKRLDGASMQVKEDKR